MDFHRKGAPGKLGRAESPRKMQNVNFNTAAIQRQRLLHYLRTVEPITTLEARQNLDIMHPAARILESRQRGHKIHTHWYVDHTERGKPHRVARYVLLKRA